MSNHYLCLAISPVNGTQLKSDTNIDVLTIRKALQDALAELFGVTTAGTYIDVLAVTKFTASPTLSSTDAAVGDRRRPWGEVVLRVHPSGSDFLGFTCHFWVLTNSYERTVLNAK
ncbi:hypothetical protein V8B97DRAFT_1917396 [Scleroderma yunnanense]